MGGLDLGLGPAPEIVAIFVRHGIAFPMENEGGPPRRGAARRCRIA